MTTRAIRTRTGAPLAQNTRQADQIFYAFPALRTFLQGRALPGRLRGAGRDLLIYPARPRTGTSQGVGGRYPAPDVFVAFGAWRPRTPLLQALGGRARANAPGNFVLEVPKGCPARPRTGTSARSATSTLLNRPWASVLRVLGVRVARSAAGAATGRYPMARTARMSPATGCTAAATGRRVLSGCRPPAAGDARPSRATCSASRQSSAPRTATLRIRDPASPGRISRTRQSHREGQIDKLAALARPASGPEPVRADRKSSSNTAPAPSAPTLQDLVLQRRSGLVLPALPGFGMCAAHRRTVQTGPRRLPRFASRSASYSRAVTPSTPAAPSLRCAGRRAATPCRRGAPVARFGRDCPAAPVPMARQRLERSESGPAALPSARSGPGRTPPGNPPGRRHAPLSERQSRRQVPSADVRLPRSRLFRGSITRPARLPALRSRGRPRTTQHSVPWRPALAGQVLHLLGRTHGQRADFLQHV